MDFPRAQCDKQESFVEVNYEKLSIRKRSRISRPFEELKMQLSDQVVLLRVKSAVGNYVFENLAKLSLRVHNSYSHSLVSVIGVLLLKLSIFNLME